jgi:hypothetical protein
MSTSKNPAPKGSRAGEVLACIWAVTLIGGMCVCLGWVAFLCIDDPPDNITEGVHCVVASVTPARKVDVRSGNYVGYREEAETVSVRLDDGKVVIPYRGYAHTPCRIGQDAKVAIRVGRLTGRFIKAIFVSCAGGAQ